MPRGARACLTTPWPLVDPRYLLIHSNLASFEGDLQTSEEGRTRESKKNTINRDDLKDKMTTRV